MEHMTGQPLPHDFVLDEKPEREPYLLPVRYVPDACSTIYQVPTRAIPLRASGRSLNRAPGGAGARVASRDGDRHWPPATFRHFANL
jgi:hypothetical protein